MVMTLELPTSDERPTTVVEESPVATEAAEMVEGAKSGNQYLDEIPVEMDETEPEEPETAEPVPVPENDAAIRRAAYLRDKAAMEEHLAGLTIEEMKLKESAKLCKKEREVLAEQLSNLIDNWERPAPAGQESDGNQEDAAPAADVAAGVLPVVTTTDADHERYRHVLGAACVSELSLPKGINKILAEASILSIWHLEQLRAEISQGRKEWPKGIGEEKITRIEDALMNWMSRNIDALSGSATEVDAVDDRDTLDL
jgi:hypothetical protein